jgi:hypothetical protein
MTRRSDPIDSIGPESSRRVRPMSIGLGDASRKDASVTHRALSVSRDDAYPEGGDNLLTDTQLGTLATFTRNLAESAIPRPCLSQVGGTSAIPPLGHRGL